MPFEDVFDKSSVLVWSQEKVKAWHGRAEHPNEFFYRLPRPGERQATGSFTEEEQELFLKRLEEFKLKGWPLANWGLFSLGIPGRVGYQCNAYFKKFCSGDAASGNSLSGKAACLEHHQQLLQSMWREPSIIKLEASIDRWLQKGKKEKLPQAKPPGGVQRSKQKSGLGAASSAGSLSRFMHPAPVTKKVEPLKTAPTSLGPKPASIGGPPPLPSAFQAPRPACIPALSPTPLAAAILTSPGGAPGKDGVERVEAKALAPLPQCRVAKPAPKPPQAGTEKARTVAPRAPSASGAIGHKRPMSVGPGVAVPRPRSGTLLPKSKVGSAAPTVAVAASAAAGPPPKRPKREIPESDSDSDDFAAGSLRLTKPEPAPAAPTPAPKPKPGSATATAGRPRGSKAAGGHRGGAAAAPGPNPSDAIADLGFDDVDVGDGGDGGVSRVTSVRIRPGEKLPGCWPRVATPYRHTHVPFGARSEPALDGDGDDPLEEDAGAAAPAARPPPAAASAPMAPVRSRGAPALGFLSRADKAPETAPGAAPELAMGARISADLLTLDLEVLGGGFQGVLMDLFLFGGGREGGVSLGGVMSPEAIGKQMSALKLDHRVMANNGLLFAWAAKCCLADAVACMEAWGFRYVENLTWVQLHPSGQILAQEDPIFRRSHLTLLIGRQGAGDLELRHQRTADVIVGPAAAGAAIPEGVYAMIETLLTEAGLWESTGRCRLLELTWHGQKSRQGRPGWVTVVQET